ncbi:TrmH family RNA methyltransferase [Granulicoccus phenolivorans]|uniref:TrmH family RNA methyltransferase n=1 Tax=Granulicoccus phenolivorans TaxID=266854 RepID=UPI0004080D8E|nr:RNA methyltransferase [Granulicoccus phenolivorans]
MNDPHGSTEPTGLHPASQGQLRSARKLRQRKQRLEQGLFLAEGPQAVREALATPGACREVYIAEDAVSRMRDLIAAARAANVAVRGVPPEDLAALADTVTPQGVIAVCRAVDIDLADLPKHPRLIVLCAQVRDPGNAGTVIRCADAFGADAVIFSADSVEVHNPKVVRASVGSLFHLPIVVGAHLGNTVASLRDSGMQVLAADGGGSANLAELDAAGELARPTVWVMGNEAWGLPPEHAVLADRVVSVPLYGNAESLNLATAAAVCLYTTATAQRR